MHKCFSRHCKGLSHSSADFPHFWGGSCVMSVITGHCQGRKGQWILNSCILIHFRGSENISCFSSAWSTRYSWYISRVAVTVQDTQEPQVWVCFICEVSVFLIGASNSNPRWYWGIVSSVKVQNLQLSSMLLVWSFLRAAALQGWWCCPGCCSLTSPLGKSWDGALGSNPFSSGFS